MAIAKFSKKDLEKILENQNISVHEQKRNNHKFQSHYNKYKNKKIKKYGLSFDSIGECERYENLLLQQRAKLISDLEFHKKKNNIILIDDPLVIYEPDFCYNENGQFIIEDFKGTQTKEFILKKKMIINMLKKNKLQGVFRLTKKINSKFVIVEEYTNEIQKGESL